MKFLKWLKFFVVLLLLKVAFNTLLFASFPFPGTIPILMYHFIGDEATAKQNSLFVTPQQFESQMKFLKRFKYRIISLNDYYKIKAKKKKARGREIVITFDDGQESFLHYAVPILQKYQFPVTQFIITDRAAKKTPGYLSKEQIQILSRNSLIDFQSHTVSHRMLSELSDEEIQKELTQSKIKLEDVLHKPVSFIAYPVGDFNERVRHYAKEAGYQMGFTTGHKRLKNLNEDMFSTTRIKVSNILANPIVFWYHISGIHQWIKTVTHKINKLQGHYDGVTRIQSSNKPTLPAEIQHQNINEPSSR